LVNFNEVKKAYPIGTQDARQPDTRLDLDILAEIVSDAQYGAGDLRCDGEGLARFWVNIIERDVAKIECIAY
jgi:hypothetical protein